MAVRETSPGVESGDRLYRSLEQIKGLVDKDNRLDYEVAGGLRTYEAIYNHWVQNRWDAYTVSLEQDAASYRAEDEAGRAAIRGIFGTLYRAESVVDEWMAKLVEASRLAEDRSLTLALMTQAYDEKMHKDSIGRIGREVIGIRGAERQIDRKARQSNNFVAERFFKTFNQREAALLDKPSVTEADFREALFIYGVISEDAVANNDAMIRREHHKVDGFEQAYPGMNFGQLNVRRDEGRHVRIAFLSSRDFLRHHPEGRPRFMAISTDYLNLAEDMFLRAKNTRGLIDSYIKDAYGPQVDALYYYATNLTRFAYRLSELGLTDVVSEIQRRVTWAIERYTNEGGEPIVEEPDYLARKFGSLVLLTGAGRKPRETSQTI